MPCRANPLLSKPTGDEFYAISLDLESIAAGKAAKAGGFLYRDENDYTGLAALDPHNRSRFHCDEKRPTDRGGSCPLRDLLRHDIGRGSKLELVADYLRFVGR